MSGISNDFTQIGWSVMPITGVEKFTKERILTNTLGWTTDEAKFRFNALYKEFEKMSKQGKVKIVPIFVMRKEF